MASRRLLLILLLHQAFAELEVFAPSSRRELIGSTVVLQCTFSINQVPFDPRYFAIIWSFQGRQILVYDSKGIRMDPRVMFNVEAAKGGNASLTVANVTLSDGGAYSCLVVYSPERMEKDILLEVQVRPVIILPTEAVHRASQNTQLCVAAGFFPQDINITWSLDGKLLNKSYIREPVKNKDSTYNATSSVTFTPTPETKTLSCIVHHASLHGPLQKDLQLIYEVESSSGTIAACIIVPLLVILIAAAAAVWWKLKRRRKANGPFTLRDIEGPPKLIDGEEAALYCTVDHCPEDLSVTWLMRRTGRDQEIQTSQMRGHEEEESLLDASYVIRSQREGRQYVTSLSFIPHMERHKDVTFICRGVRNQHNDEKMFHCKTIYAKPRLSQPVMRSLFISGEMKYLLNLENFYPKSIRITWRCGVGGSEDVISSTEASADNPDRTYSVSSEVRIPEDRHKDPGFTIQVTWEHESMESPESRELSIRDSDYRWRPVVEELQIPRLLHGVPAVLLCDISGYFPGAITVKWRRGAECKMYEESDGAANQSVTSMRAADNTYSCTSSLSITPTLGAHQGAEYICLVDHPALEKPIERSTGRLQVIAAPQMLAPIEITMADSSRVRYSLNLQKFYPKDLEISWHYEDTSGEYPLTQERTVTTQDNHLTYDVTSAVRVPEHVFKDPQMKVIVEWKHEAMETPETRSLSIRDLPWKPNINPINVPILEDDTKANLTCEICRYFPDLLSVSWFIKKDEEVTALPIEPSKMKRTYSISHKKQKDKTYSYEASLSFTPLISADQGSEIICRVEHPSLECPIERSTGPLHIGVKKKLIKKLQEIGKKTSTTGAKNQEVEQGEELYEDT